MCFKRFGTLVRINSYQLFSCEEADCLAKITSQVSMPNNFAEWTVKKKSDWSLADKSLSTFVRHFG